MLIRLEGSIIMLELNCRKGVYFSLEALAILLLLFLSWSHYVVFPYITCCLIYLSKKNWSVSHEYICQLADSDRIEKLMRDLFDKGPTGIPGRIVWLV